MRAAGSFLASFLSALLGLFHRTRRPQPAPPDSPVSPAPGLDLARAVLQPRVLLIVYNPVVDVAQGTRLVEKMGWHDPDRLVNEYIQDIDECSGGLVAYDVVERVEVDEFPIKLDHFQYRAHDYVNNYRLGRGWHSPDAVDYGAIIAKFNILSRVAARELDEVWLFGGPYFGLYESTMGGAGAFFCNAPPLPGTAGCPRRFVIMGFSYERGVGEMEEDLGHRAESILREVFRFKRGEANLFERYSLYNRIAPGRANVGLMHFAPNSVRDYDWGNPTPVLSCCDDWDLYPNLPNPPNYRMVNSREWGSGGIRLHHKWWLRHLPHADGATDGVSNNWWSYVIDPNLVR